MRLRTFALGAAVAALLPSAAAAAPDLLRILSLNLWQSKIRLAPRMRVVARGLRALRPHLAALQEVSAARSRPNTALSLARRVGLKASYARAHRTRLVEIGVALLAKEALSRVEVIQLPTQPPDDEPRVALCARLGTPVGPAEVCNVHLSYRLEDGEIRARQLARVDGALRARAGGSLRLLVGDLNAAPDRPEVRALVEGEPRDGAPCYVDAFATARPSDPGITWDNRNPNVIGWRLPDRRIDYVLVAGQRRGGRCRTPGFRVHTAQVVFEKPDERGVYASDHYGVLVELAREPER